MSLIIFLALCILGLDFMIYVLFKLFFGDKRSVIARRVAAQRNAARAEAAGLIYVPAHKNASDQREPDLPSVSRTSTPEPPKRFAHNSYHTRIA
jgi:hypothetical protein